MTKSELLVQLPVMIRYLMDYSNAVATPETRKAAASMLDHAYIYILKEENERVRELENKLEILHRELSRFVNAVSGIHP